MPEILKEIFDQHSSVADVKFELTESYTPWVYCVQYRESDFDFVSRLMENEGIYYFFKHHEGRHTLVIADSFSAHRARDGRTRFRSSSRRNACVATTRARQRVVGDPRAAAGQVCAGRLTTSRSRASILQVQSSVPARACAGRVRESSTIRGDYVERGDGELYARTRIEEVQAKFERVAGRPTPRAGDRLPVHADVTSARRSERRVSRRLERNTS